MTDGRPEIPDLPTDRLPLTGLDTSRIDYLIDDTAVGEYRVTIVGVGSGGAIVVQRLAMCGVRHWSIFDPDVLEPVNLVKHPALRSEIGHAKATLMAEWLRDRNPAIDVETHVADIFVTGEFRSAVEVADIVICAVDNQPARSYVNAVCVELRKPCVFGMVFRTGLGGEVYAYLPGETGCYDCLGLYLEVNGKSLDEVVDLTPEERENIYGIGIKEFRTSGLAVDIGVIASLHAHYCFALLGSRASSVIEAPTFNWLTVGLRRQEGVFRGMYDMTRFVLRPQASCHLACGRAEGPSTRSDAAEWWDE